MSQIIQIANGFYNIRGSYRVFLKLIDVGTHMSLLRLSNDKFLVVDAVQFNPEIKKEFDELTENGSKIEAFLAVHPFHTGSVPQFHEDYPNVPLYGCPRHLRKLTDLPWAGDLNDCTVRTKWKDEVEMRIPEGSEFVNPLPESYNHFSSVFVYHKASRTLHVDDTICYNPPTGFIGSLLKLIGKTEGMMTFHISMKNVGLLPTVDAPYQFRDWVANMLNDWDFDNICTAHMGNKIGEAHLMVKNMLNDYQQVFDKLREQRLNGEVSEAHDENEPERLGTECG